MERALKDAEARAADLDRQIADDVAELEKALHELETSRRRELKESVRYQIPATVLFVVGVGFSVLGNLWPC